MNEIDDLLERLEHPAPPEVKRRLAERIVELDNDREIEERIGGTHEPSA